MFAILWRYRSIILLFTGIGLFYGLIHYVAYLQTKNAKLSEKLTYIEQQSAVFIEQIRQQERQLVLFEQQQKALQGAIKKQQEQTALYQQHLQQELSNERNKKWADQPVPNSISRLLEQASNIADNKANLPTNHCLSDCNGKYQNKP